MSDKHASQRRRFAYDHLCGGVAGGAAGCLLVHPLDLLKVQFAGARALMALHDERFMQCTKAAPFLVCTGRSTAATHTPLVTSTPMAACVRYTPALRRICSVTWSPGDYTSNCMVTNLVALYTHMTLQLQYTQTPYARVQHNRGCRRCAQLAVRCDVWLALRSHLYTFAIQARSH
jgi:hypothetical protein